MTTISISDRLIGALCNTLLYSLWQGILLAVTAGLIIVCTRKAASALRYNLLVLALLLFAVSVAITFAVSLTPPPDVAHITQPSRKMNYTVVAATSPALVTAAPKPVFTDQVSAYLNNHHNTIVLVWFLIICARSLQLGIGLYGTYLLRRVRASAAKDHWPERMQQLAAALGLRQTIVLLESGLAKTPLIIGHMKPVVLVPLGLLTALAPAEVEAILIHELAHIKRRDYLVNLLQNLLEVALFFNPAVLWVSSLIRTERENCCDDLALAHDNNRANYIRALVSCEEYQASVPPFAMAFPGSKNTLLHRVSRLAGNGNYSLNLVEKIVLTICLAVLGLGVFAFTTREHIKKAPRSVAALIHQVVRAGRRSQPTVPAANTHRQPPAAKVPLAVAPKPDTNKQRFDTSRAIGRELYRENLLTDTTHLSISLTEDELIVNGVIMPQEVHERIYRQFGRSDNYSGSLAPPYENKHPGPYDDFLRQRSEEIAAELIRDNLVSDKNHFTYNFSRDGLVIDGVRQSDELFHRILSKYFKPDDNFNLSYVCRDPGSNYRNPESFYRSLGVERRRTQDSIDKQLVADLLQDGLITDTKNVVFTLNYKEVIVNGKRQSDEIFQKYKEKYMPANAGSDWNWTYSHHE